MSVYSGPINEITWADLSALLDEEAVENVRLEFKSEVPSKDEILKKLSSFANTFGGTLIIGAKADENGKLVEFCGVDPVNGIKQKLVDWCQTAVEPPMVVAVSHEIPVPAYCNRICYVVQAPASELAPHFLNGRKGVYVRTDEYSKRFEPRLASEPELLRMLERRQMIDKRRRDLLERSRGRYRAHAEPDSPDRASLELSVFPVHPSMPLLTQDNLFRRAKESRVRFGSVDFPFGGPIWQHESIIFLPEPARGIAEVNVWGGLYYAVPLRGNDLHLPDFVAHVIVFLKYATALMKSIGYFSAIVIELKLRGILRKPWSSFDVLPDKESPRSMLDDQLTALVCCTLDEVASERELAGRLLSQVFLATNAPQWSKGDSLHRAIVAGEKRAGWPS